MNLIVAIFVLLSQYAPGISGNYARVVLVYGKISGMPVCRDQEGMMKSFFVLVFFGCLVFFSGCRGMYEGFKSVKTEDCYRLPYPEQAQCLQQVDVSYEEYEQEREKTLRRQ
jgi:hypothetical protein